MSADNDRELNQMIVEGKVMDAFEKFYADDVAMAENNDPPTVGKDANRARELQFFDSIAKVNRFDLVRQVAGADFGFAEWDNDYELKNGYHVKTTQISRRVWRDGKVVEERFFYGK